MQRINTWKIVNKLCDNNDKLIKNIDEIAANQSPGTNPTYLLDLTKNKYTFIEKYVYDIAMFHFARLDIHNTADHYVEFWFKTKTHNNTHELHVDCDECLKLQGKYQHPILASVTYLNDFYNSPTIITNIDVDTYNNKEFEKQTELILSLPKRNKHITFNGKFFHGSTSLSDNDITSRYIIAINLWDKKPLSDSIYCNEFEKHYNQDMNTVFEKNHSVVSVEPYDTMCNVNVDNNVINYKLFDDLLYNKKYATVCYIFNDLIKKYSVDSPDKNTFKFIIDTSNTETKETNLNTNSSTEKPFHTFIISLKSSLNRRLSIINRLKYTNIKEYTIIDAVDGNTELGKYNFKLMPNWVDPIFKRKINVGEIGCFLSHYFIWKYIVDNNINHALILEDDCVFMDSFNTDFEEILEINPILYDYFTLGRRANNNEYNLGPEFVLNNINDNYVIPKYSYNNHSYILTNSGAKILANDLAIEYIMPVDEYIPVMYDSYPFPEYSDYFKKMPKLRAVALINDITDQDDSISNIINGEIYKHVSK